MLENVKNSNQKWSNVKYRCKYKNKKKHVCEKNCISNPSTYASENGKYLGSIISNSVIICDKITKVTKTVPTKTAKTKAVPVNLYILLAFLLITVSLLIIVSIYFYLIEHRSKPGHLLPHHDTTNKLKEIDIKNTN